MYNPGNNHSAHHRHDSYGCCGGNHGIYTNSISRRKFVQVAGTAAVSTVAISGLSWSALGPEQVVRRITPQRLPLTVKPILTYEVPVRRDQTSWRNWGGIQTEQDALQEVERIGGELKALNLQADFPVNFLPVARIRNTQDISNITDLGSADVLMIYAAGGWMDIFDVLNSSGKPVIFFCRYKSGPVYLWYEIISPRYLRQHTDKLAVKGIDEEDVVIDSQDELLWRLRALGGLKNTLNSTIIAIGGPDAWAQPPGVVPKLVQEKFKLDIRTLSYDELGRLITGARSDASLVAVARALTDAYLQDSGIKLETKRQFVENCFVLEEVLSRIMEKYNCRAITINQCMGTIMPLAETSACLTLSLLNDAGYLAFCESDFVVVPTGLLLGNITGKPVFLNDPTYPHDKIITLAHCTAPRRMDGKKLEPARILTHFESDYGAAPKVEMLLGQTVTNIMPDFAFNSNVGMLGKIVDNPFLDICRSQIDISYTCDSKTLAESMQGFHWITVYGDYMRETAYALKKIGIGFEKLM
jgi:hypothetical protein